MSNKTTWLDQLFLFPGGTVAFNQGDAPRVEAAVDLVNLFNIIYTGGLSAGRTCTYPLPVEDVNAYNRTVFNNTSGGFALTISVGVGTTVSVAAGATKLLIFEPAGVRSCP